MAIASPAFAGQGAIVLRFHPNTHVRYRFHLSVADEIGPSGPRPGKTPPPKVYDAILRFSRIVGHRYTMHGRTVVPGFVRKSHSQTEDFEDQLDRTTIGGTFNASGQLIGYLQVDVGSADYNDAEAWPEELAGYAFMNLSYPKLPVKVGTTWVRTLRGEQYYPNGEMIKTTEGQKVEIRYKVESIGKSAGRTLIHVSGRVRTAVETNEIPVGVYYTHQIQEDDLFTLDAADGLLVEGKFRQVDDANSHGDTSELITIKRF